MLKQQMDRVRVNYARRKPDTVPKPQATKSRKRTRVVSDSEEEREAKRVKASGGKDTAGEDGSMGEAEEGESKTMFEQPALITGATLKDYQLEGVAWMAGLHQNGISGILGTSCSNMLQIRVLTSTQRTRWVWERRVLSRLHELRRL